MKTFFYIYFFLILTSVSSAQPLPPADPVPLDGGIVALIAAGAAFGMKRLKVDSKK